LMMGSLIPETLREMEMDEEFKVKVYPKTL
jgi:hypothetical protein